VSNHGGGQLNGALATADALPLVGEAIEGEFLCFSTAALEPLAIGSRR
jgi:isopentenyl diphosphate isomerase/L-lactate dehydrogenase-like FMN-dependent dehydrogenase